MASRSLGEPSSTLEEFRNARPWSIKFAWTGVLDRNGPHAYKIHGPTFLVEFNNTQNKANHIHADWWNMLGDFAVPLAKK